MTVSRELSSKRELHIEGLRAISCIMVLLGHCLIGFVPSYVYNMFPVKLLWYAAFAIDYFFMISGYGICSKFISRCHINCVKETILRYIKIVIPVYVSCLLPYLFMKLGWMWNIEACIIFTCICFCPLLKRSLSIKPLQIIAQYSTGIYFLQLPLICSVQSKIYVQLIHKGGFIAFITAVTITLIILEALVFIFNNTIMKISARFAARIAQYELLKKIGSKKP